MLQSAHENAFFYKPQSEDSCYFDLSSFQMEWDFKTETLWNKTRLLEKAAANFKKSVEQAMATYLEETKEAAGLQFRKWESKIKLHIRHLEISKAKASFRITLEEKTDPLRRLAKIT